MTDRQARNLILAAEALGYEREPDLHPRFYDSELHEDARDAHRFLIDQDFDGIPAILARPEPIPAPEAAARIVDSGPFSLALAEEVLAAAEGRGFVAPEDDLPLLPIVVRFDQAQAAVAFLWERDPGLLTRTVGEAVLLAPTPETARTERHGWELESEWLIDASWDGPF